MDDQSIKLFRSAIEAYLGEAAQTLEPGNAYLPYNFDFVKKYEWPILGGFMVEDELRELTNVLNRWCGDLQRWHAWNNVVLRYGEADAWAVRREFVEALVHQCLLEPSAIRDKFTFVATNAFHQVRLSYNDGYQDYLEGDPKHPNEKPKFLTRRKKESRLAKLVSVWPEANVFIEFLKEINSSSYQEATSDYRNRVNHAIGPRLELGMTQAVTRKVSQATQMKQQSDGTYLPEPIPGKLSVGYAFGGTRPINLEEARQLNLAQYHLARRCYLRYFELLKSSVACIKTEKGNA